MDNVLKNILLIIAIIVVLAVGVAAIYFVASSNDAVGDFVQLDDNSNIVEDDRFNELDQMNQDLLDQIEALRQERKDALDELRNRQDDTTTVDDSTADDTMADDEYNLCLADVSASESNAESAEDNVKDFENELEDEIDNINEALDDLKIAVQFEDALLSPTRVPAATASEKEDARDDVRDAEDDLDSALDDFDNALDDLESSWKDEIDAKRELRDTTARCAKVTQEGETINYNALTRNMCPAAISGTDISLDAAKDFTNDLEDLENDVDDNSVDARSRESSYQVEFDVLNGTLVKFGNGVKDARDSMDDWEQAAEDLLDDLDNDIEDAQDEEDDFEKDEEDVRRVCARL